MTLCLQIVSKIFIDTATLMRVLKMLFHTAFLEYECYNDDQIYQKEKREIERRRTLIKRRKINRCITNTTRFRLGL